MYSTKILEKDFHKYPLLAQLEEIPDNSDIPKLLNFKVKSVEVLNNFLAKSFGGKKYKVLTVVGSRRNTKYSEEVLEYLFQNLVNENIIIVSGLAYGVDAVAHKLALKYNFPTISFPGSGLGEKIIYPRNNLNLAKEILSHDGLLASEWEDEEKSELYFFPLRNRLMVAISDAVLVVEAREKSGTLITARLAMEYGKNLGVIPNNILAANAKGSNRLIQDGAQPVLEVQDILDLLRINPKRLDGDNSEERALRNLEKLPLVEQKIWKIISTEGEMEKGILLEKLSNELKLELTESLTHLMNLEIEGLIVEDLGEIRIKK